MAACLVLDRVVPQMDGAYGVVALVSPDLSV